MFRVGDRVRLKQGLEIGESYDYITFLSGMKESFDKNPKQEITYVRGVLDDSEVRLYRTNDCGLYMSGDMLELVENKEIPKVEVIEKYDYKFIIAKPYVHCIYELESRHTFAYCRRDDTFDKNKGMEVAKLKMDIMRQEDEIKKCKELITFSERRIEFMKDKLEEY